MNESIQLNDIIYKLDRPCIFKNILKPVSDRNTACNWTPEILADLFKAKKFTFRIGKKDSPESK